MRYPGGTFADYYDWQSGVSVNVSQRGSSRTEIVVNATQTIIYGTREFLEFCSDTGAEPLITVNIVHGSSADAAAWVRATNIDGFFAVATGSAWRLDFKTD